MPIFDKEKLTPHKIEERLELPPLKTIDKIIAFEKLRIPTKKYNKDFQAGYVSALKTVKRMLSLDLKI